MFRSFSIVLLISFCIFNVFSQASSSSTISGVIQDQFGAAVIQASVDLNKDGVKVQSTTTDHTGHFHFNRIPPGSYKVQVSSQGFESASSDVTVGTQPLPPLSITLPVAQVQGDVTVSDDPSQMNTEASGNKDTVALTGETLSNLPVFDQDYIGTMSRFLDPGTLGNGGVSLIVNGMEVNNLGVSASAIKEIKINQDPYSAEFQRPGRGRIEVITKPGSPEYHGTFNFTFRDAHLNARDPFALTRPPEQRRIYEGVLTGPVGNDKKTSFLFSFNRNEEDRQAIVFAEGPNGIINQNVATPIRNLLFAGQLNHSFTERNNISLRYSYLGEATDNQGVGGTVLPEAGIKYRNREQEITYTQEIVFSPNLVNSFRILFGAERQSSSSLSQNRKIVVNDAFTAGGAQADQLRTEVHTQLSDVLAYTHSKHLIKAGINVPDISRRGLDNNTNSTGTFYFSSLQDYRANRPFSFRVQQGNGHDVFLQKALGLFVQDEYHIKPNFMVTAGVRWDWENYYGDTNNFAPRSSFAYSPGKGQKTVIRGGVGLFFDRIGPRVVQDLNLYNGSRLLLFVLPDPGFPDPLSGGGTLGSQPASIIRLAPEVRTPSALQYSCGVERQIWKSTTLAVNYVGTRGFNLLRSRDINAPLPPLFGSRPDPTVGVLRQIETVGRSVSNSLEVTFRGNATKYLSAMAQYRLASNRDDTSGVGYFPPNSYDLTGEWGRSDFDRRHRFEMLGTVNPGKLLNIGVSISLYSGLPYTLTTGLDDFGTGTANARPLGVPRNSLEGPGYANVDLRWSHDFVLIKGKKKDGGLRSTLALDAFNVFNHVNFVSFVGNELSPFFGQAVAAQPPRRLQLSFRLKF
jgi:outer membrane receptor protein involved in Fe transport